MTDTIALSERENLNDLLLEMCRYGELIVVKLRSGWFCRMFGWRDPKNAMIYVNPSAEDLARKL